MPSTQGAVCSYIRRRSQRRRVFRKRSGRQGTVCSPRGHLFPELGAVKARGLCTKAPFVPYGDAKASVVHQGVSCSLRRRQSTVCSSRRRLFCKAPRGVAPLLGRHALEDRCRLAPQLGHETSPRLRLRDLRCRAPRALCCWRRCLPLPVFDSKFVSLGFITHVRESTRRRVSRPRTRKR